MKDKSYGIIPYFVENKVISYLIIQHRKQHWGFPKGHAEPGESELQSACRELTEETGITQFQVDENLNFMEHYRFYKRSGVTVAKTVLYFAAQVLDKNVVMQEEEIQNFLWGTFETIHNQLTFDEGKNLLEEANEKIRAS
jgi:bis(5'-nucleosidyl)-tetraphosphatase